MGETSLEQSHATKASDPNELVPLAVLPTGELGFFESPVGVSDSVSDHQRLPRILTSIPAERFARVSLLAFVTL